MNRLVHISVVILHLCLTRYPILHAQEKDTTLESDVKTGWKLCLILPTPTFDSDLGFQYGAMAVICDYGDGSKYPDYNHSLFFEVSRFTKGSAIYRFNYNSEYLIPGIRTSVDLSYLPDQAYDFFGFNGYESVYNQSWTDDEDMSYKSRMFYKKKRLFTRLKADFTGKLAGNNINWAAGFALRKYDISSVDIDKLNKGKDEDKKLPSVEDQPGLYEKYIEWGMISEEDKDGGFNTTLKAGIVYDTRDNLINPMKGIWTEAVLVTSLEFLGSEKSFIKFGFTHRQYFTLIKRDLSLAYRLGMQTTIAGDVPYYYQNIIETPQLRGATNEGLGGSKSLRGIKRNRAVGDGFLYGNIELRWKVVHFSFIKQKFYLGLNGFLDGGQVIKKIDISDQIKAINDPQIHVEDYFKEDKESFHISYGIGIRIAVNQNQIIAFDYGITTNKQDGDAGIYVGMNYLF